MPKLTLNLFGNFQAFLDGVPINGFNSDKTRALLAYLAIEHDRSHRRETLAALLWPTVLETSARQSLSQALSNLRKLLKDADAAQPFILADRDMVRFNGESDFELDTEVIGEWGFVSGDSLTNPHSPITLYQGPLLHGFTLPDAEGFEEWLLLRRESVQREVLEMFDQAIGHSTEQGHYKQAIETTHKQLEVDPWREETHRNLMRAYALNGQRGDAVAQFEKCRNVLKDALGVPPSAETLALLEQIKSGAEMRSGGDEEVRDDILIPSSPHPIISSSLHPLRKLPTALTPFVGRERELSELKALIANPDARLITLVGAGGMGKTRLAIEAATQAQAQFADGAALVPLASVTAAAQVLPVFAQSLGIPLAMQTETQAQVLNTLRPQRLLCVVDNAEHLLDEGDLVGLLMSLLQAAPGLKLLVTSREALATPGEWVFDLDGLGRDAQTLFVQTARRVQTHWQASEADTSHIEKICHLVDGMPLGIELAASWLRLLSCAEVAEEIEHNVAFLSTTARHVDERHRSIIAVFDASWRMLSDDERRAMHNLAVFCGSFTREAAKAVAGASLLMLSALVAKSLVRRAKSNRYDLHELVRQYATQQLVGEQHAALRDQHQQFYIEQTKPLEPFWLGDQAALLKLRFFELDNLRYAIAWAFDASTTPARRERAAQLLSACPRLWRMTGEMSTTRAQLAHLLREPNNLPKPLRAWSLLASGFMALWQTDVNNAELLMEASIKVMTQPDNIAGVDDFGTALALCHLGLSHTIAIRDDYPRAAELGQQSYDQFKAIDNRWGMSESLIAMARFSLHAPSAQKRGWLEQSLTLKRSVGDENGTADTLLWLSETYEAEDLEHARRLLEESRVLHEKFGNRAGVARALLGVGEVVRQQDRLADALQSYQASLRIYQELEIPLSANVVKYNLGHVLLAQSQTASALAYFKEALRYFDSQGSLIGTALGLTGIGGVAAATNRATLGTQFLAAAQKIVDEIRYVFEGSERNDFDRYLATARAQLSEAESEAAWADGCALSHQQATQEALSLSL